MVWAGRQGSRPSSPRERQVSSCSTDSGGGSSSGFSEALSWQSVARSTSCAAGDGLANPNFPMYVVSVERLLRLRRLPSHEELLEQGFLEEVHGDDMHVHFISQCWLSSEHPDPDSVKLSRFQRLCREVRDGDPSDLFDKQDWEAFSTGSSSARTFRSLSSELNADARRLQPETFREDLMKGYVWWDYLSVPQGKTPEAMHRQNSAIHSIPRYIERCAYFWVLVPEARHADTGRRVGYEAWQQRGWCRFEEWGNFLSLRNAPSLVLTSGPHIGVVDQMDFMSVRSGIGGLAQHAACCGSFSCCAANHKHKMPDGTEVELRCDKEYVGAVLSRMFASKVRHYRVTGKSFMHRFLLNSAYSVLAGTGNVQPPVSVEELCQECGAEAVDSNFEGLVPLSWACSYGDVALVQDVLKAGARADQSVTILQLATQSGNVDLLRALLNSGSLSVEAINKGTPKANITALDRGVKCGKAACVRLLLAARASPTTRRKDNGHTPLHTAAEGGYPEICQLLLDAGAGKDVTDARGRTPIMLAAQRLTLFGRCSGKCKCAEVLLAAGAHPEIRDKCNRSPKEVATADGHTCFLEVLREHEERKRVEDLHAPREDTLVPLPKNRPHLACGGLGGLFSCAVLSCP